MNKISKFPGLGLAKDGTHHWWIQRLTAIALVPLSIWFIISFLHLMSLSYGSIVEWFEQPLNKTLLVLWIVVGSWHALLGIQVVIEDYVHKPGAYYTLMIITKFILIFLATIGIIYVLGV